ncbi:MAG: L-rhamnose mutarotase [Lachnospiraceae bacterium]|nr:L-rhamnose mutarotase [Lachnospiraceae bacterium]
MRRFGQICKVKPDGLADYARYHANPIPGVNEMIKACNLQNYSIYSIGDLLFTYCEYVGEDYDADMAKMAADPTTQKWWGMVTPLMEKFEIREGGGPWTDMKEIYHLD